MRGRATASLLALALILAAPQAARPDYTYQGALLQPLATVDPVLPGQFFDVWRPGHLPAGSWSLGGSAEALRNSDNSDDWETILSVTGAYGLRDRLAVGLIVPYIARDPEFNESELLDLKTFARYSITDPAGAGVQLGAELLLSLPTASVATTYPFSLDTTVARLTVAASMEQAPWSYGLNLGYQHYLSSTSGDDRDVLYGLFAGRGISDRLRGVLEYSSYIHSHEETGLDESLTDSAALVGVRYMVNDDLELGLAAGSGLGDAFADLKTVATLLWVPGRAAPARPVRPARALAPPRVPGADLLAGVRPGRGGVLIQISNRSGDGTLGEKVARILQRDGYVVPVVEQGSDRDWKSSYLFFRPAAVEQAARITELLRPARVNMVSYQLEGVDLLLVIGRDRAGL